MSWVDLGTWLLPSVPLAGLVAVMTMPFLWLKAPFVDDGQADVHEVTVSSSSRRFKLATPALYLRIPVTNYGLRTAKNVIAYLRIISIGGVAVSDTTEPLAWRGDHDARFRPRTIPGLGRGTQMVDICKVSSARRIEALTEDSKSGLKSWDQPGRYVFSVYVESDGIALSPSRKVEIEFDPKRESKDTPRLLVVR